jgi:hypothetical protein
MIQRKRDLSPHTAILIETPVECWARLDIPRGAHPLRAPANGNPLAEATWWRWV